MIVVTGEVEGINKDDKRYGLKVQDRWINGWGKTEIKAGDHIHAEVEEVIKTDDITKQSKTFYNITKIEKVAWEEPKEVPEDDADKLNELINSNKAFMKRCFDDANEILKPFFSDGFVNPDVLSTTAHTLFLSVKNKY